MAGTCTAGTSKSCDDGIACTADSCDATAGCSSAIKPWGTTCATASAAQKYPFCAGTLCTGVEEDAGALNANMTTGILTSVDRYPNLSINTSGYDQGFGGGGGGGGQSAGLLRTVVESPLGLSANSAQNNTEYTDMRRRLTVGGNIIGGDTTPSTLVLNTAAGTWAAGGPTLIGLSRALRAVDMATDATGNEIYLFGGNASAATGGGPGGGGTPAMAQLETATFNGATWTAGKPLLISNSTTACANAALSVTDIYAAASNLFYITAYSQAAAVGGGQNVTGVAVWNGNATAACGGITNLGGVAYTATSADPAAFQTAINAPTFILRAIHGTSASHMLAGGDSGTLTAFDNGVWTAQAPTAPLSAPSAWGTNYAVRSVYLAGSDGWVAGTVDIPGTTTCRSMFVMHGTFGTSWTWDKIVATTADVTTCSNTAGTRARTALNKVWVDSVTGSVYLVGSTGTDNNGNLLSTGATQTREAVLRVKMK